jgi:cytochrome c-type biogenesis protein
MSLDELAEGPGARRRVLSASLVFLIGFLFVFVVLGASASALGRLLATHRLLLDRVAGALLVALGASLVQTRIPSISATRLSRAFLRYGAARPAGRLALGAAFAFCWTPCASPILASVLTLASASASLATGVLLLVVYGAGLALPFLAMGMAFGTALTTFRRVRRYQRPISIAAGFGLVVTGAFLLAGGINPVSGWVPRI